MKKFLLALTMTLLSLSSVVKADSGFIQAVSEFAIKQYPYHASKQPLPSIGSAIAKYADIKGISRSLLTAVISKESNFKHRAQSKSGAIGLTQVVPKWHYDKISGRDIKSIDTNVEVGATILKDCLNKSRGNETKALRCYCGYRGVAGIKYANVVLAEKSKFESFKLNNFPLPPQTKQVEKDYEVLDTLVAELTQEYPSFN